MMENENLQETVTQALSNLNVEPQVTPDAEVQPFENEDQPPTLQKKYEDSKERNIRVLRERAERFEREAEELRKALKQNNPNQVHIPQQNAPHELGLGDDEIAEGKHLKAYKKELEEVKRDINQYKQQNYQMSVETKLRTQFPDFDKVVNRDNIAVLSEMEPEIANTLNSSQDMYSTGVSAYKFIKQLGIYTEDNYAQHREVVKANASKPKPLASLAPQQGDSPLSKANVFANGLTKELQQQLNKEMNEARKNFNGVLNF